MYVQGVSTRKVKAITEHLCGVSFSAPSISELERKLDRALFALPSAASRKTTPYLILDARYEKVREDGVTQSQAVLLAIGINWEGQRQVLAVELANRESQSSGKDFLLRLKERGLAGVELAVSDDHAGLKKAIREVLPEAAWGSALTCTSCVTPWTPCPARPTTTASKELCWPLRPQRHAGGAVGLGPPGSQHGKASTQSWSTGWSRTSRTPSPLSPACAGRPATASPPAQEEHRQA